MEDLETELEKRSLQSRTIKIWVSVVIRPVLIIMLYCRASHVSDWLLPIKATEMLLPYMFAAHNYNYSRYGLYYVQSMTRLHIRIFLISFVKDSIVFIIHQASGMANGQTCSSRLPE